ncbi:MAG: hypothetical protein CBC38_07310 [Gammaproteobacteria bacterium TMED78]|nr:MAG: hypothetical protein CBC38_07310 [Gammaproteobacteria bacterium TMED78]|tara:strand:+ start:24856 stop:25290 length:435 start_codon:yes stop_codon:yes gene_type:complete
MKSYFTCLNVGRVLVALGFYFAIKWEVYFTWRHIGDNNFLLQPESRMVVTHGWYHFFREVFVSIAAMISTLILLFVPKSTRSPLVWFAAIVLIVGFYAPFWVGMPFMPELSAPSLRSDLNHIYSAIPSIIGILFCYKAYFAKQV